MSLDREMQGIADRQHLKQAVDAMGPRDYAVLIRFVHDDPDGKTGYVSVARGCFSHVAVGLMDEARWIVSHDRDYEG
jgi:hypothetical protein